MVGEKLIHPYQDPGIKNKICHASNLKEQKKRIK